MYFGTDRNRTAGTAYRQTECTGCPHRVLPKDFPALILPQRAGNLHIKALSLSKKQIFKKERGNQNGIFYNSSNRCKL